LAGEKTEKPTAKRVHDAREKGQVAKSSDFTSAVVLTGAAMSMGYFAPYAFSTMFGMMRHTLGQLLSSSQALKPMDDTDFSAYWSSTIQTTGFLLLPLLLGLLTTGILANIAQTKPLFSPAALTPKLDKLNPLNGFKRMFSMRSIIEVLKALIKMTIIGSCGYLIISKHWPMMMGLGSVAPPIAWQQILGVLGEVMQWCCIFFLIIGGADWRYQAWELEKQLRMSLQDIKDERKNTDGDPLVKAKARQLGAKIAMSRQLSQVPMADVVITNPTHYAIAIKYDPDVAPAPIVVAKGKDHFAQKIKAMAKESDVPMVENKPLARALYPLVEAETMIPPDLFVAVAEVLAYVFAKNKGRKLAARKREAAARKKQEAIRKTDTQKAAQDMDYQDEV
jgi:flagellar biosynthetic protein FlhB